MNDPFFARPILNSPYEYPRRHWELDASGQPTQVIKPSRRRAEFITPIPKPRKQKGAAKQDALLFDAGLSTQAQQYHSAIINGVRAEVDKWRQIPNPADWRVTPETARLLQHWRHHAFNSIRPFFCQVEAGITRALIGSKPITAVLDPYNPTGSTAHVSFNTSKTERWDTSGPPPKCHLNWVILDSDWEAEFCRVAEAHPKVRAYVKNHNLGLDVPYRYGSEMRIYRPDFIVRIDDGRGADDPLNLIVEIKGYRREDAKEKKSTMDTYWVPGVNHLGTHGRWAFAEFTDVWQIQADFAAKVEAEFNRMIESAAANQNQASSTAPHDVA